MCAIAVFGMMFTSCKKKDSGVNLDDVVENGFSVVGPATAVLDMNADNSKLALMGAGINEYDKKARAGLYEKYVALEGGQEFELVYNDGGNVTHYGADLELGDPYDVDNGITIQVYKGVMVENQKMTVPETGFYHIALDLNVNNDLPDKTIIVSPVEWELSDGTMMVPSEFNKTSMTWTIDEKEYQSSSKYKYRWGNGWKIKVTPAADVNIETNLGEGMKSGAADIKISRGVHKFVLTWNLTGGAIEKGFKNEVTLVRALEAADYSASELVLVGEGVNDEYPSDYANNDVDGGWGWGHIASLGTTPAKDGDVYTWTADVKLVGGKGFKVRSNKKTDVPFVEIGDGPDQDQNFTVGGDGTYKVTVVIDAAADEKTVTIVAGEDVVIADYTNSVVGLVGAAVAEQKGAEADAAPDAGGWGWGNFFSLGTPAKNGMVYTWTGTVKLQEGGCKFRSATTDAVPYVAVGKDGGDGDITIAASEEGTYVVTLIINAEKATKTVTLVKQ